jgi:AcrR family transcriptional regulator
MAPVNTVVYGELSQDASMADQLSAADWLDQGLKTLAQSGFTALKAEPLARAMGVSRGSFYWHFADIGAFHAAILRHWREVAASRS